jgi:hypothetical protein
LLVIGIFASIMLIRAFISLMMVLMLGLGQGGPVEAATYPDNPALSGLELVAADSADQDRHEHPARTGGHGQCHHASVPCSLTLLFQRNSALEHDGSSPSWAMPGSADLKPIALKRDPPIPRPLRS